MVEFFDPVRQENISYHIDKKLQKRWDKLKDGQLVKKDEDRVYIVDGRERMGKSVFTLQQAKYINPDFCVDDVCFTPEEFLTKIRTAEKGSVIVFDEAFRGLSSKGTQSRVNKKIVQAMMEMGQRNLVVFIVLPTFFLLELYAAVLRSHALFHIYKDTQGKRAFRIYNYQKKSLLYRVGKKKGLSYAYPKVIVRGKFFNTYGIDENTYRKKKAKSLREMDDTVFNEKKSRYHLQRDYLFLHLRKCGLQLKQIEDIMFGCPETVTAQTISVACKEMKEILKNTEDFKKN